MIDTPAEMAQAVKTEALTLETEVETAVTGWQISGWAAVGAIVAANLLGVFLHF